MPLDVQKYQMGASYKMIEHYIRYRDTDKDVNYKNPDIDKLKAEENYSIGIDRKDKYKYLKDMISAYDEIMPPIRKKKDRIVMTGFVFTVPAEIANTPKEKEYFEHCYEWARYKFGKRNIICAEVHRDEIHEYFDKNKGGWVSSRAHMHMGIIPYTREKGVNCSKFMTRQNLTEWHSDLDKYIFEKMRIHDLTFSKGNINGRSHEELKRESIKAVTEIRDNLDKEIIQKSDDIEHLDKIYNAEIQQMDIAVSEHEKKCKQKVESLEKELAKAEQRFAEVKHNMNMEFKEKRDKLDKILKRIDREIKELYEMAQKYDLKVFEEKARNIETRVHQIIESPEL